MSRMTLAEFLTNDGIPPREITQATKEVTTWFRELVVISKLSEEELADRMFVDGRSQVDRVRRFLNEDNPKWEDVERFLKAMRIGRSKLYRKLGFGAR